MKNQYRGRGEGGGAWTVFRLKGGGGGGLGKKEGGGVFEGRLDIPMHTMTTKAIYYTL